MRRRLCYIVQVIGYRCFPAVYMRMRMVAYSMAFGQDAAENRLVLHYIVAYTKERCFCMMLLQFIQHPGGYLRVRAIVERKEHLHFIRWHMPYILRKKPLYPPRCIDKITMHAVQR